MVLVGLFPGKGALPLQQTPVCPMASTSPGNYLLCGLTELRSGHALPLHIAYPSPHELWWSCIMKLRLIKELGLG